MAELSKQQREFLQNPFVGVVTTLREDGSPHSTVVWIESEDGGVSFNTARGRAKERHLAKDPRISLLVVDPQNAYKWVAITGRAELVDEGADDQIDRLAKKYMGEDKYPWRQPDERRVTAVLGTHTHVQTNDARVLPGGTAAITDAGMTGPHDSVIGSVPAGAIKRMVTGMPVRLEPATGDVRLEGALVECGDPSARSVVAVPTNGLSAMNFL